MLNLPIGSLVAASKAACVDPKSLPSPAFFVHLPWLARYSRLSAFSMSIFIGEDATGFLELQACKTGPPLRRRPSPFHRGRPSGRRAARDPRSLPAGAVAVAAGRPPLGSIGPLALKRCKSFRRSGNRPVAKPVCVNTQACPSFAAAICGDDGDEIL